MPSKKAYYPAAGEVLKKLQKMRLMKKRTRRLRDSFNRSITPDLFDVSSYGEMLNDDDYVARYMMMTVPGYWSGWLKACKDVDEEVGRYSTFSAHDVLVKFRKCRKEGKKPTEMPFAISNSHGAALMRLVKRHARLGDPHRPWIFPVWATRIQTSATLRLVPDVMRWVKADLQGNRALPLPT